MFFDASTSYDFGGVCGELFFKISHSEALSILVENYATELNDLFNNYLKLVPALFSFQAFVQNGRKKLVRVNIDKTNTVTWLYKHRCSKNMGFLILWAMEYYEFKNG